MSRFFADPDTRAIVEAQAHDAAAWEEFTARAHAEMARPLVPPGALAGRGCFHEGCDPTARAEEGGTHWCALASISP